MAWGGVIGAHEIDRAVGQGRRRRAIGRRLEGRDHPGEGAEALQRPFIKHHVVGAKFHGNTARQVTGLGVSSQLKPARRRGLAQGHPRPGGAHHLEERRHAGRFRHRRAGPRRRQVIVLTGGAHPRNLGHVDRVGAGQHADDGVELGHRGQGVEGLVVVKHNGLGHVGQQCLERRDAGRPQFGQGVEVAGHDGALQGEIDEGAPFPGGARRLKPSDAVDGGVGIGHAHDRRDTAARRGGGARGEVFLVGEAGVAHVDVGVEETGEEELAPGVDDLAGPGRVAAFEHRLDAPAVADQHAARALAGRRHQPGVMDAE